MRLPGIPRALHAQPVHRRDQVDQVRTGQVGRAVHQLSPIRKHRIRTRHGQPHHDLVRAGKPGAGPLDDPVGDPGLIERGQYRMAGRREYVRS